MHTPPVKPPESGFSEGTFVWGIRTEIQQGRLSRNKVSVGEPADGSPPKKGGLRPTLKTFAMQGKPRWFSRQFHGSLPRTKRSIERPSRARSPAPHPPSRPGPSKVQGVPVGTVAPGGPLRRGLRSAGTRSPWRPPAHTHREGGSPVRVRTGVAGSKGLHD